MDFQSQPASRNPIFIMNDDLLPDLLAAVEQQLISAQTPYVKKTFDRLLKLGLGEADAKHQIALCLGDEMDEVLRTKRPFDEKSYRSSLDDLPFAEESESEETEEPPSAG
jgi:hypothetical protein